VSTILGGLLRRSRLAVYDARAEDQGDDAECEVFVDPGQSLGLDQYPGLLQHFPPDTLMDRLVKFKYPAG